MASLLVIVVNYHSAGLVEDCLALLESDVSSVGDAGSSAHVVVVENASGEAETLRDLVNSNGWSGWCEVMPLTENRGFAAGNNAAIRAALQSEESRPDYVWLLNPDTLVRPGALEKLLAFMEGHPDVGICGSRLLGQDGELHRAARRFPSILGEFESTVRLGLITRLLKNRCVTPPDPNTTTRTDWVVGASMMIRTEVFDRVGLMDEGYFLYFEEVDFCLQAQRAGWECWYVPESQVVHLVGLSTGVTSAEKPNRCPKYWFEARARFFEKNYGPFVRKLADLAWASGFALFRVRQRLTGRPDADPPKYLHDFVNFNFLRGRSPL